MKSTATRSATLTVEEAAQLLGITTDHAYGVIRRTGALDGVKVLRLGRLYRIPRAHLEAALGIEPVSA